MRRRLYALLTAAALALSGLSGCSVPGIVPEAPAAPQETASEGEEAGEEAVSEEGQSPETGSFPMRIQKKAWTDPDEGEIRLAFFQGQDIPYVSLTEYMPLAASLYEDTDSKAAAPVFQVDNPVKNCFVVSRTDNGADMAVNTEEGTIEFLDYDRFVSPAAGNTVTRPGSMVFSEAGSDGAQALLEDTGESYDRRGGKVLKLDLSAYGIGLMEEGGECYVPLQTLNDLLLPQTGKAAVFNGLELLVGPWGGEFVKERYSAEPGSMSEAFADFNYRELCLCLDTFYGLKAEHGIGRFGDFFDETELTESLSGTDPAAFDKSLRRLVLRYFHDSCSGFRTPSVLTGKDLEEDILLGDLADPNARTGQDAAYLTARKAYYPDLGNGGRTLLYEEVGDTAVLAIDTFTADKNDYYTQADRENPGDTVELISYAHEMITRYGSPVRNVVLDLSNCRGGSVNAAAFVTAWIRGSALFGARNTLTGALSAEGVRADINLDGLFDEADRLPDSVHVYCLISQNTFSLASLVAAAVKGKAGVTLLGTATGGGACLDRLCTTASGAEYRIPGTLQTGIFKEGSFYRPEGGTEPDFVISSIDTFYNRILLTEVIRSLP